MGTRELRIRTLTHAPAVAETEVGAVATAAVDPTPAAPPATNITNVTTLLLAATFGAAASARAIPSSFDRRPWVPSLHLCTRTACAAARRFLSGVALHSLTTPWVFQSGVNNLEAGSP